MTSRVEYDEEKNTEMQIKTVKNASEAAEYEIPKQKDSQDVEFIEVKEDNEQLEK